jgi:succinate dehydrogenase / fumarate reductase cytochrome b subunit
MDVEHVLAAGAGEHRDDGPIHASLYLVHPYEVWWHPSTVSWLGRYTRSSIGAKHLMAVSGLSLLLFAIFHMVGHLQMFGGADMYNAYAHFLQELWEVKWPVRAALLGLLVGHAIIGIGLAARNRAARPVRYAKYRPAASSPLGRAMVWSGLAVFAFIAFHILHFTLGQIQPEAFHTLDHAGRWDAYKMYVHGFQNASIYGVYLAGIAILSMHLGHGAASWLQSLGLRHPKYPTDRLGPVVAVGLFVGYMIPPTAVLLGVIR